MKKIFAVAVIGFGIGLASLAGCSKSTNGSGGGSSQSTTAGQNCTSSHLCVNGVCNCGADGKGNSCTDDTKCVDECQVCTGG